MNTASKIIFESVFHKILGSPIVGAIITKKSILCVFMTSTKAEDPTG
jgi:hypothetical protein